MMITELGNDDANLVGERSKNRYWEEKHTPAKPLSLIKPLPLQTLVPESSALGAPLPRGHLPMSGQFWLLQIEGVGATEI